MSEALVIDAHAWIEYLDGSDRGIKLRDLLNENRVMFTSSVTLAEVISKAARTGRDYKQAYDVIASNSTIVNADEEISYQAGITHAEIRRTISDFGLADAFVLTTARKAGAKILTGDPHFKEIQEAIII